MTEFTHTKHWILIGSLDLNEVIWLQKAGFNVTYEIPESITMHTATGRVALPRGSPSVRIITTKDEEEVWLRLRFGNDIAMIESNYTGLC